MVKYCQAIPALLWARNISYHRIDTMTKKMFRKLLKLLGEKENKGPFGALQELLQSFWRS